MTVQLNLKVNKISRHYELLFLTRNISSVGIAMKFSWVFEFRKINSMQWLYFLHTFFCLLCMIFSLTPHRKHRAAESNLWTVVNISNIFNPSGLSIKYSMYEPAFHDGIHKCEATIRTKSIPSLNNSGTVNASSENITLKSKRKTKQIALLKTSQKTCYCKISLRCIL